ncbi:DUF177 domain-containing protein [Cupriavidus pampae]|uniref:Large ribosomal RNA subunit accumulation protein YceD n=1 Tax=Cupriavidus pampae TaxID=659251 RepID=A0ABN7XVQ2_9BURK|nr:DUF177 domain-containing protein [Cupriavidus pampae]CAG9163789.1 hypothetical protein LMG32289_00191 [Cupriavidus pampae]
MSQPTPPTSTSVTAVAFDLRETDIFAFCRKGGSAEGDIAVRDLPRILAETAKDAPATAADEIFHYTVDGFVSEEAGEPGAPAVQRLYLDVTTTGRVWQDCQRCLAAFPEPIDTDMRFEVMASEEEADAVPDEDEEVDVIVGSRRFSVLALIEDEVLLALPVAPKHDVCPAVHEALVTGADGEVEPEAPPEEEKRPSPFAALAGLKTTKH